MSEELTKLNPEEFGVTTENAVKIEGAFAPKIIERNLLTEAYGEIIGKELTPALAKKAAALIKKLGKCNSGFMAVHKSQKEFALKYGQFVDAWKRKEVLPIDQMKEILVGIRDYEAIQEEERLSKLQAERELEIAPFIEGNNDFALKSELLSMKFMSKELYDGFLLLQKTKHEERIQKAKDDAEALAKSEAENALLRKAFQENQAKATKEKADLRKKADDAVQELETIKSGNNVEGDPVNKTDAENIADFLTDLQLLKMKYSFTEAKNKKLFANVYLLIDKINNYINEKS